jgi:hypothetical protein
MAGGDRGKDGEPDQAGGTETQIGLGDERWPPPPNVAASRMFRISGAI